MRVNAQQSLPAFIRVGDTVINLSHVTDIILHVVLPNTKARRDDGTPPPREDAVLFEYSQQYGGEFLTRSFFGVEAAALREFFKRESICVLPSPEESADQPQPQITETL